MILALNILFVCPRLYSPETNGLVLRVINVARQLAARGIRCHAAVDASDHEQVLPILESGGFASVNAISAIKPVHWARVLRLSNENYQALADPCGFRRVVGELQAIAATRNADVVIAETCDMAEFVRLIPAKVRIVDICDSPTLTLKRHNAAVPARSASQAWSRGLELLRWRRLERVICRDFDCAITITEEDRKAVADSAEESDRRKVKAISNGVSQRYLSLRPRPDVNNRIIAFWGNLDFLPNASAISYFCEEVFAPFLAGQGIVCRIFGRNASEGIRAILARHREIELVGYVPDLPRALENIPIMINPMIMGAGQKNKVLEAFALGLAVVSTRVGMSGIEAVDDEHFLEANDPASFATAIRTLLEERLKRQTLAEKARQLALEFYSWDSIGERWHDIILGLAQGRANAA